MFLIDLNVQFVYCLCLIIKPSYKGYNMNVFYALTSSILVSASFLSASLTAAPIEHVSSIEETVHFVAPTQRYLITHPLSQIKPFFKSYGVNGEHVKIFKKAIEEEKYGFFGYHGGRKEFRIFQDMIRFGIEEILGIPIRPDFHFLRVPGDPQLNTRSAAEFLKKHSYNINDDLHAIGKELLSMNIALYENHTARYQSTVFFFVNNHNYAQHDYENKLATFFQRLGVDPVYVHEAFEMARTKLANSGFLMQFFDTADYQVVNEQSYLSHNTGKYYSSQPISELILDTSRTAFPQFRLLMNNHYTLNPNSSLSMKRYSLNGPEVEKEYEDAMRAYFQTLPVDVYQKEAFKAELLSLWETAAYSLKAGAGL